MPLAMLLVSGDDRGRCKHTYRIFTIHVHVCITTQHHSISIHLFMLFITQPLIHTDTDHADNITKIKASILGSTDKMRTLITFTTLNNVHQYVPI